WVLSGWLNLPPIKKACSDHRAQAPSSKASVFSHLPSQPIGRNLPSWHRFVHSHFCGTFALDILYLVAPPKMTSDADRKTYWDLLETLRWIATRDEQLVAVMWDWSDDEKVAVALFGIKVEIGIIRSGPGLSGTNRGADLNRPAPQGDEKTSIRVLDEVLRKVHSGRVRMTAIKCDGNSEEQTPVPMVELNDLRLRLVPGHPVAS